MNLEEITPVDIINARRIVTSRANLGQLTARETNLLHTIINDIAFAASRYLTAELEKEYNEIDAVSAYPRTMLNDIDVINNPPTGSVNPHYDYEKQQWKPRESK